MLRNPLLIAVYYFLYSLVKTILRGYYRNIRTEGFPTKEPEGPLFILSNHPNALMDPLVIVSQFRRPVFFLANAGMFRHPFANWFLNTFFCIPIERPKDVGRILSNADSFRRSREHLESGGALYIAPEGTCYREYRIRPLKTGTARIALDLLRVGHVDQANFLIAGIHYADPPSFRSRFFVRFAPMITLRREELSGPEGHWEDVINLTQRLEQTMQSVVPHTVGELDTILSQSAEVFRPALRKSNWVQRLYTMRDLMNAKGDDAPNWLTNVKRILGEEGLSSMDPNWLNRPAHWRIALFAPVVLWVLLHHILIFGIPELLRRLSKVDKVYDATVRYLSAIISYPIGLLVLHAIYHPMLGQGPWLWPYLVLILLLGPWSWQIGQAILDLMASIHFRSIMGRNPVWAERLRLLIQPLTLDPS